MVIYGRSSPGSARLTVGLRVTSTTDRCMMARRAVRVSGLLALALLAGVSNPHMAAAAMGSPEPRTFPIVYIREAYPGPGIMPSILETSPADEGLAGARDGTAEINTTGGFLGWNFKLYVETLPAGANVAEEARRLFTRGPAVIVADLRAPDLLQLADAPAVKGSLILDMRTTD